MQAQKVVARELGLRTTGKNSFCDGPRYKFQFLLLLRLDKYSLDYHDP